MNHIRSFTFLAFLLVCSLYSYWYSTKSYEWIVPYVGERTPAAVRESPDYRHLLDKPLRVFKRDMVAGSIQLKEKDHKFLVSFGQYAVSGSKGPNYMCLEYPFIRLKLVADGVAVSGRQPEISVVAPCKLESEQPEFISDIQIPFEEIYRQPAQDTHFTFEQGPFATQVHLRNTFGEWPLKWQLESVHLLRDRNDLGETGSEVISAGEILDKRGAPVLIHIKK